MKRAIFLTVVSTFIFVIFPMKFYFPKPEIDNQILKFLFYLLGKLDSNFNQCPSLHVSFAFLSVTVYCREIKSKFLKVFLCLWGFLLAISILFVYQHHFIDFVGGTLIFLITCIIFPRKKQTIKFQQKVKNSSLLSRFLNDKKLTFAANSLNLLTSQLQTQRDLLGSLALIFYLKPTFVTHLFFFFYIKIIIYFLIIIFRT